MGGHREIASGSISGRFDVNSNERGDGWIVDNKITSSHSYSVDYRHFKAIMEKAKGGQIPAIFVNFETHEDSLAIIREKDLLALLEQLGEIDG